MTVEYLATEAPPRQRHPWLVGIAITVLLAVVGGLLVWSDHLKNEANDSLSSAVIEAQERARVGEGRVLSTLTYANPMIWSQEVPEDVRAGLRGLVETSAAEASDALTEVVEQVTGLTILPWQSAQAEARERVLDLILAERVRFDRIAIDARDIGEALAVPRPQIEDAAAALRASGAEE